MALSLPGTPFKLKLLGNIEKSILGSPAEKGLCYISSSLIPFSLDAAFLDTRNVLKHFRNVICRIILVQNYDLLRMSNLEVVGILYRLIFFFQY